MNFSMSIRPKIRTNIKKKKEKKRKKQFTAYTQTPSLITSNEYSTNHFPRKFQNITQHEKTESDNRVITRTLENPDSKTVRRNEKFF